MPDEYGNYPWQLPQSFNFSGQPAPAQNFLGAASDQSLFSQAPAANQGFQFGAPAAGPQGFMGKAGNWLSNGNNLGTVVQGLGSLTSAYLGFKQLSMAKDQLRFQKDSWGKNFANSQQTYNTNLEDRIRGRTSDYGGKENDVQSYLAKHKLGK